MKKYFVFLFFSITMQLVTANSLKISSPNNALVVKVSTDGFIHFSAFLNSKEVLGKCTISIIIDDMELGQYPKIIDSKINSYHQVLKPIVPNKQSVIQDNYNELVIDFEGGYSLELRAYNEGFAYRFKTMLGNMVQVKHENLQINFADETTAYFPEEHSFLSHNEYYYPKLKLAEVDGSRFCSMPVFFERTDDVKMVFTEANVYDYPNMLLYGQGKNALKSGFPKFVMEAREAERAPDRNEVIAKEAEYIALTDGNRSYPWRIFYVFTDYAQLLENDLVYKLSDPLKIENTDWIKPGQVAWDWWNGNNITGVDFKSGVNNNTYKYFIDCASKFGLEYIILDEGWSKSTTNVKEGNPEIDVEELVAYGKEKNVGIILWLLWKPLDKDLQGILDLYHDWGVKGIKVDFMQRSDQYMVNYLERVAKEAAKKELLVDFHGAFKPVGLRRAYPNVITYEGVKGLENCKWGETITPEHDVILPFTRMVAGPMDYTPGAMDNAQKENFTARFFRPMSQGTRCHQVALYVIYESPLQMLADNPTHLLKEEETTKFISRIPVTWDETKLLDAQVADYIVIARKKNDKWYVGAITDWSPRELTIDFSFLEKGEYDIEIMQDGINAERNATDYKKVNAEITNNSKITINLAPGGGWAAIISKK